MRLSPLLCLGLWAFAGATACAARQDDTAVQSATLAWDEDLGVGFELPAGWESQKNPGGTVWSGPKGGDSFFTTLTVQRAGSANGTLTLDKLLESAYAPVSDAPGFTWDWIEPASIGGTAAVRYAVRFELHESSRRKLGVLMATTAGAIDVAYGASDALFATGVPVFEDVLTTIWIDANRRPGRETTATGMVGSAP